MITHIIQCTTRWNWYSAWNPSWGISGQRVHRPWDQLQILTSVLVKDTDWRINLMYALSMVVKNEGPDETHASTGRTWKQEGPANHSVTVLQSNARPLWWMKHGARENSLRCVFSINLATFRKYFSAMFGWSLITTTKICQTNGARSHF